VNTKTPTIDTYSVGVTRVRAPLAGISRDLYVTAVQMLDVDDLTQDEADAAQILCRNYEQGDPLDSHLFSVVWAYKARLYAGAGTPF
jgi:hypothetical protein